jgi:hypothetical protein
MSESGKDSSSAFVLPFALSSVFQPLSQGADAFISLREIITGPEAISGRVATASAASMVLPSGLSVLMSQCYVPKVHLASTFSSLARINAPTFLDIWDCRLTKAENGATLTPLGMLLQEPKRGGEKRRG